MIVNRATLEDVPAAAPLFAAYREFYGEAYETVPAATFLASRIARGESVVALARVGDEAVGFAQVYPSFSSTRLAPIWVLNDLYVAESARGTGIADALLEAVAAWATDAGAVSVELSTAHTNHRAQAVYARHGYQLDEVFRTYEKSLD